MTDEFTPDLDDRETAEEDPDDVLVLLDRLEELVGVGRRFPLSTRVMVEEEEFLGLLDQIRGAVPREIRQAQRVVEERSDIITSAQQEAAKILDTARSQAEYIISEQGVSNEARQRGEEYLRQVELDKQRSMGQIDDYALNQIGKVEEAIQDGLNLVMDALREASTNLEQAKRHVGQ
ncbi:MAG: ATPase [Chloroflexota bacterium]|nr:ATPase [Chloroflexia bacterium]MDQ3226126.1 ATPase [Chloroflexota bacterium]